MEKKFIMSEPEKSYESVDSIGLKVEHPHSDEYSLDDILSKDIKSVDYDKDTLRKISRPKSISFSKENYFNNNFNIPEPTFTLNPSTPIFTQVDLELELERFPLDISFRGVCLAGFSFAHRDLFHVEFRDCDLSNCDFSFANLTEAHFINCVCDFSNFHFANCDSAWFHHCGLNFCNFTYANLLGCYFDRSWLADSNFSHVNFTNSNLFKPHTLPKGFYSISMNQVGLRNFILDLSNDSIYLYNHFTFKGPNLMDKFKKFLFIDIPDSLKFSSVYLDEAHLCYDFIEKIYLASKKGSSSSSSDASVDDIKNEDDLKSCSKPSDFRRLESKFLCHEKRKFSGIFDSFRELFNPKSNANSLADKKDSINSQLYTSIDKKAIFIAVTILTLIFMFSLLYGLLNGAPKGGF